MKTIKVVVDWCGKNYAAYIYDKRIGGTVLATSKTFDGLQKEVVDSLQFHIEGCMQDGDSISEDIKNGKYKLEYEKRISAILHDVQEYTTLSAISRASGIRHAQLSHYANAVSVPKPPQLKRIIDGLHHISQEIAGIV